MWSSEARKLFEGVVLFLLDVEIFPVTLGEVFRQLHTEKNTPDYFSEMIEVLSKSVRSCLHYEPNRLYPDQ